jgi:hypothetical protein
MARSSAALLASLALAAGCGKKTDASTVAPAASSLAPSAADPAAVAWHYVVDPKSSTHIELPGLKEHIKGDTTAAQGTLDVVARDLAKSRGGVRVDLGTFRTSTFGDDRDATQTEHARTWLEVHVGDKTNYDMRWAELAIRDVGDLSAPDLTKVAPLTVGQEEVRFVTMTVHGDLLVHGHKVSKDPAVEVAFHYPPGASADSRPSVIDIKSRQSMPVTLQEHDVRPRDPAGQVLEWTAKLLTKVAETADVLVDIRATPAP